MPKLIIHSNKLTIANNIKELVGGKLINLQTHFAIFNAKLINLEKLRNKLSIDLNYLPTNFNPQNIKLLVTDMDSTLINIECIDEIADFAGLKNQVAAITEKTMHGGLGFTQSLQQRVALLKNINVYVLSTVYEKRLQLNVGGIELINFCKQNHIKTAVVSGGFDFFTKKLQQKLKLDYQKANMLEITNAQLTGKIIGKTIDAKAKADFVIELCQKNNINADQVISCGDGANDLQMMKISGLSIAYHAKPKVNQQADIIIKFGGLDKIIDLFST